MCVKKHAWNYGHKSQYDAQVERHHFFLACTPPLLPPMQPSLLPALSLARSLRQQWSAACGQRPNTWKTAARPRQAPAAPQPRAALGRQLPRGQQAVPASASRAEQDIDDVVANREWSVEHVLPRSVVSSRGARVPAGPRRERPARVGEATRGANQRQSNLPLVLWPGGGVGRVRLGGELHAPAPPERRARLARKWLFLRATYSAVDSIDSSKQSAAGAPAGHRRSRARGAGRHRGAERARRARPRGRGQVAEPAFERADPPEFLSDARFKTLLV